MTSAWNRSQIAAFYILNKIDNNTAYNFQRRDFTYKLLNLIKLSIVE